MLKYTIPIIKFSKGSINNFYLQKFFFVFFDYIIIGFFIIYCMADFTKFKAENKEYFLKGFVYLDAKIIGLFKGTTLFLKNFSSGVVLFPSNDGNIFFDICKLITEKDTGLKLVGFFFDKCYITVSFISDFVFVEEHFIVAYFKSSFRNSVDFLFKRVLGVFTFFSSNLFNMDNLKFFFDFLKIIQI